MHSVKLTDLFLLFPLISIHMLSSRDVISISFDDNANKTITARSVSEEVSGTDQKKGDVDEYPSPKDKDKDEGESQSINESIKAQEKTRRKRVV